jgi:hypothetical protein
MLRHPHEVLHDPDVLLRTSDALLHGPDAWLREPDALLREPDASLHEPDATRRLPDALLRLPGDSSHSGDAFVARTDALSRHDDASLPDSNGLIPPKGAIQQFARMVEGLAKQFDDPFPWRTGNPACPWFIDAAGWTGRIAGGIPRFRNFRPHDMCRAFRRACGMWRTGNPLACVARCSGSHSGAQSPG